MLARWVGVVAAIAWCTAAQAQTPADVRFMQGMIRHHAQALVMAVMIPTHTSNQSVRLLGERIAVSQRDEIKLMERWLEQHDAAAEHHGHEMAGGERMLMPGMLTDEQLAQLDSARGAAFDRLLLERMIQHHAGALTMVADLFATEGAAQESEIYRFASDVDADQRAEIKRMRALLGAFNQPPSREQP